MERIGKHMSARFIFLAVAVCLMVFFNVTAFAADEEVSVSAVDAVIDCAPAAEVSAPAPAAEVSAPAPTEEVSVPAPAEEVSEPAPAEEESEPAPTEEVTEPTPAEEVFAPADEQPEAEPVAPADAQVEPENNDPAEVQPAIAGDDSSDVQGTAAGGTTGSPVAGQPSEAAETLPVSESADPELPGAPAPAEENPVELPEGSSPELTGENSTTCYAAQFYGLNDSPLTLRSGEEMELSELVSSLGYEGEIESALSSNPEVLEIADGIVRILNPFGDEKITLIINGQEVTIRVHDPEDTPVTAENIVDSFSTGGTYHLSSDVTVSNGSLIIPTGKEVILDLNGFALKGKDGTTGSVITVNGTFTLNDSSAANSGVITGGTGTTDSEGHFFSGGGVYNNGTFNMNGGSITGITDNKTSWGFSGGGVYNSGTFNMTGGSISNNSLAQTSLAQGGGVYNSGTFNMTGGAISDNSVGTRTGGGYGGGVYNSGTFNMSNDAQITGNTAPRDGGGIYNYSGRFSMTGGKITGNTSEKRGGGVFWLPTRSYVTPVVEITMTGGEITGNTAREGGGVWFNGTACTFGGDAQITGNTDGIVGSKAESNLFLANGSIMLDVATGDDAPRIGMLIGVTTADKPAPGELLAVSTKHIAAEEYFSSDDPAYWFVDVDERLRLVNAAEDPRVAYVAETGMVYSKVQSAINTIPREKAWTVIMHGDSTENLLIDYRSVPAMTLDLNGHTLRGTGKGSVITIEGGKLTLNDSSSAKSGVITGGNAECGGGVYIWGAARLIMTGGTITGNTATKDGGGVYSDCELRMTGGVITGNSAGENGGGVYNDGGVLVGGDAKIIGNTAGKEGSMTDNNLYLVREKYVAYAAVPDGMRIGVTAARAPTADSPFTITTIRVQAGDEAYFPSDNSSYVSVFDSKDKYIKLIVRDSNPDSSCTSAMATPSAPSYVLKEAEVIVFDPASEEPLNIMLKHISGESISAEELNTFALLLDGVVLPAENYTFTVNGDGSMTVTTDNYTLTVLSNGDILITISANLLKTLAAGNYDLAAEFSDQSYRTVLVVK